MYHLCTVGTATQDSLSASINTFDTVDDVQQLTCICLLSSSPLRMVLEQSVYVLSVIDAMLHITVCVDFSPKRMFVLKMEQIRRDKILMILFIFRHFHLFTLL